MIGNEKITLAIGDWEPYTSNRDKSGKIAEIIVYEAYKLENIDVKFVYYPWIRSYDYVKDGKHPGSFPWFRTEERLNDFIINKEPIIIEKTVFFHLKILDFDWENYSDLKKYRIGGTIGYAQSQMLEDQGLKIEYVAIEDLNYKKILAGRLDLYANSIYAGIFQIKYLFDEKEASLFTYHKRIITEQPMFMLFSKNNPNSKIYSKKLDSGLIKLKESGRYKEILSKLDIVD